jgi:hypothetical protein
VAFQLASLLLGLWSKLNQFISSLGSYLILARADTRLWLHLAWKSNKVGFFVFTVCSYSSVYPSNYLLSVRCDIGVCHHSESVSSALSHRLYASLFCYNLWGKSIALSMAPLDSHLCFLSKRTVLFICWFSGLLTVSRVRYQLLILPEPLSPSGAQLQKSTRGKAKDAGWSGGYKETISFSH